MLARATASAASLARSSASDSPFAATLPRPQVAASPRAPDRYQPLSVIRWIWGPCPLDKHERALLCALVTFADNDSGDAGPRTLAHLQRATALSRATVGRAANGLLERGLITRVQRWTEAGDRLASLYGINREELLRWVGARALAPPPPPSALPEPTPRLSQSPLDLPEIQLPVREPAAAPPPEKPASVPPTTQPESFTSGRAQPEVRSAKPALAKTHPVPSPPPRTALPTPASQALLTFIQATPELRAAANPEVIALIAKDLGVGTTRPIELALKGLREMAAAAGDAVVRGKPWPLRRLECGLRTWILGARPDEQACPVDAAAVQEAKRRAELRAALAPLPVPPPPEVLAVNFRSVTQAIDALWRTPATAPRILQRAP